MSVSIYVEDVFKEFYFKTLFSSMIIPAGDRQAIENFNDLCVEDRAFTEKQSRYMIALMKKYHDQVCDQSFDYASILTDPKFKHPFRVIDESRKAYILKNGDDVFLYLKFPYAFKERFEKEFEQNNSYGVKSIWDHDHHARYISVYSVNLPWAHGFLLENGFEIHQSLLEAVAAAETAWENQDDISPYCYIEGDRVVLKNCSVDSQQWFETERSNILEIDLLTAKTAGYILKSPGSRNDIFAKIAASKSNTFWIKDLDKFFRVFKTFSTKCCIIMDHTEDKRSWIERFVDSANRSGISRSDVKVCFREKGQDDPFNQWIKESGLGGKTDQGKIFIFEGKPAKWVFRDSKEFKIVATTSLNPPMNMITRCWLNVHPLSFYLTDIKPTQKGGKDIVEL